MIGDANAHAENGFKPALCVNVCVTINTMLKLTQTFDIDANTDVKCKQTIKYNRLIIMQYTLVLFQDKCKENFVLKLKSIMDFVLFGVTAQPVHDELEYIKMRYKSPARSSFRDNNKMYATLTTQSTAYSTMSRGGVDGPNYSDDSADRILHHHREQQQHHPGQGASSPHHQYRGSQPHIGQSGVLQVPYQGNTPTQTEIPPGMTELPPEGQTELPGTPVIMPGRQGGGYPPAPLPPQYQQQQQQQQAGHNNREEGGQVPAPGGGGGQSQYRYNITGQTQGVTVI